MVTRNKVRLDAEAIKTLYVEKGYPEAEVSGRFEKTDIEGRAVVYFDVTEGAQTRIKNIYFSGNSFVSTNTLKGKLGNQGTRALFQWNIPGKHHRGG